MLLLDINVNYTFMIKWLRRLQLVVGVPFQALIIRTFRSVAHFLSGEGKLREDACRRVPFLIMFLSTEH